MLAGHGAAQYEQVTSRFGAVYEMEPTAETPAADVAAVTDAVVAGLGFEGRITEPARNYLYKLAQQDGRLRLVTIRLRLAYNLAERAGVEPTYSLAELDYAAPVQGRPRELKGPSPFEGKRLAACPESGRGAKAAG